VADARQGRWTPLVSARFFSTGFLGLLSHVDDRL
jgi:hypothetical protein